MFNFLFGLFIIIITTLDSCAANVLFCFALFDVCLAVCFDAALAGNDIYSDINDLWVNGSFSFSSTLDSCFYIYAREEFSGFVMSSVILWNF